MASNSSHGGQQGNNDGGGGGVVDCAACTVHGKRCGQGCIMAPHFPGNDSGARDFLVVGNVFGLDNVRKKLEGLDLANQKEVVESLKWEARLWMRNPISGPYGYHHSVVQRQQVAALQQRHHLQRCMALQRMALREQQQGQQQPVLLPLFPPADGHGNGRMGGHHQDHHMTIQENNATSDQANFPNPVVFPDHQPVGRGQEIVGQLGGGSSSTSGADGTDYGRTIMPRAHHDDQDGVHRAAGGGDHQHGQSYQQQNAEYQHHPHVFASEHGRADHLPGGSRKRSRE